MVDVRSYHRKIAVERRKHPRLEFHCDATALGIQGILTITDVSLGGVFVEASIPDSITVDRTIIINTKLHSERNMFRLKARL